MLPGCLILAAALCVTSAQAAPNRLETTLEDQKDVGVTAYNNGLALVRDVRQINLPAGEVSLQFGDVAQQIMPQTVGLRALDHPGAVRILEQNYEFDLISPQKLMEKYVGETVKLRNLDNEMSFETVEAKLLSVNNGPVYQVGDQIYLGHPGLVVVPEIPENLIAKPSLIWLLNAEGGDQTIEATYLTNGLSWTADYVLTVSKGASEMDIAGWVTMNNQSGATYENAKLKLVAGDVNRASPPPPQPAREAMRAFAADAAAPMREESFAEYHLYTLPRRTTIKQNQSKQVSLLTADSVAFNKIYEYRGQAHFYFQRIPPQTRNQRVDVFLEFRNDEANNLGIPLPEGVMRIYQEDSEGMLQFVGEDRIEHTPKDEDVRLQMGSAFDIAAERTQTDYKVLATNMHESAFEIKLRNHKDEDVTVDIIEPMPGDWRVIENSHDYTKKDARTIIFSVEVPQDEEVVVTYRVQVKTG